MSDIYFDYEIEDIPCIVKVTHYNPPYEGSPRFGSLRSYQDVIAPEPEEIEYEILDENHYNSQYLENLIDEDINEDIVIKIRREIEDLKKRAEEEAAERKMEERRMK